jgi:2-phospho-L-lactate guanylyltransferase
VQWRVLVPIKHATQAKTRLRAATSEQAQHAELVRAIQLDTLGAVLALRTHPLLGGLFVVTGPVAGRESGLEPVQPRTALPAGIEILPDSGDGVVAMVADLPALRAADLLAVLRQAPVVGRSFVRDADGSGTTLLAAGPRSQLRPLFGPDSARRHLASGARELDAPDSLRCDVDSAADLRRCLELGVGMLTSQLVTGLAGSA